MKTSDPQRDQFLTAADEYIDDDGFTQRVIDNLPARSHVVWFKTVGVISGAILCSVLLMFAPLRQPLSEVLYSTQHSLMSSLTLVLSTLVVTAAVILCSYAVAEPEI